MPGTGYSKSPRKKSWKKKVPWKPKTLTKAAKQKWAIKKAQEERAAVQGIDPEGCGHQFENRPEGGSACVFCKTFMYAQLHVTGQGELTKENLWGN